MHIKFIYYKLLTECPDVGGGIVVVTQVDFWRDEIDRPAQRLCPVHIVSVHSGQSEIRYFWCSTGHENVSRFDIPVNDALRVDVRQT